VKDNKDRYELFLGFATLILAYGAFKDEFNTIQINLGYWNFTLADYFLRVVYAIGICAYCYTVARVFGYLKILEAWRIAFYIERFAFAIFVFIIFSPIILGIIYPCYSIFEKYTQLDEQQRADILSVASSFLGLITSILSFVITRKYFKQKNLLRQESIEREEIIELEKAIKLNESGFYSQAIIEAFKVLEIHLTRLLSKKYDFPRQRYSFIDLFNYAKKLHLLDSSDVEIINRIRFMRNEAAHLKTEHSKEQADESIDFIKSLIKKISTTGDIM
jgi:HEPN domain-containing protein